MSFLLFILFLCPSGSSADSHDNATVHADSVIVFSPDGAWCWFQDPRAVNVRGERNRTYACWVTRKGELQIGAFDHQTGTIETFTLRKSWGADDHNTASILVLPDRRLMVFYTQHNGTGLFARASVRPEEISRWDSEVAVTRSRRVTYSHPVYLLDEAQFYVFWRGESWKPTFSTSRDGKHWSDSRILLQEEGRESEEIRPYIKVVSDGRASIHFTFTDGHPRNEPENSVYYLRYEGGRFRRADGRVIGRIGSMPVRPRECDLVYDAKATRVRAWVWDIALDSAGKPRIAYARFPAEIDHRYHYACWTGTKWEDHEITPAGGWFPETPPSGVEPEPHYSGGIVFNHSDPSVVYLSRDVGGAFEIEKWMTRDRGEHWVAVPITQNSHLRNVRPVFPYGYSGERDRLLWMSGPYVHYTKFETRILLLR